MMGLLLVLLLIALLFGGLGVFVAKSFLLVLLVVALVSLFVGGYGIRGRRSGV